MLALLLLHLGLHRIKVTDEYIRFYVVYEAHLLSRRVFQNVHVIIEEEHEAVVLIVVLVAEIFLLFRDGFRQVYKDRDEIVIDLLGDLGVAVDELLELLAPRTALAEEKIHDNGFFFGLCLGHAVLQREPLDITTDGNGRCAEEE